MKKVGIYVGPWYERKWDETDVANGMSGSETWAVEISKQLALHGYEVFLYGIPPYEHDVIDNFHFLNFERLKGDCMNMRFDFFISSRVSDVYQYPYLRCDNCYIMVHDNIINTPLYLSSFIGLGRVKGILYLSDWHKEHLKYYHREAGIENIQLFKVTNGFSNELYNDIDLDNKENSMIWSSSLSRGFDSFVTDVFEKVVRRHPEFKVYVCSGTSRDIDIKAKYANYNDNIIMLGTISKEELANYQKRSKVWVYPGAFQESFCITAVEQCAAGNVLITPLSFGLKTTLSEIGYLNSVDLPLLMPETSHLFSDFVCRMLEDDDLRKRFANECIDASRKYSWERACEDIIHIFNKTNIE